MRIEKVQGRERTTLVALSDREKDPVLSPDPFCTCGMKCPYCGSLKEMRQDPLSPRAEERKTWACLLFWIHRGSAQKQMK